MYVSRTFCFLAIIMALSYANILEDVGTAIFGEEFTKVEEGVIKAAKAVKAFYEHHKKLIIAGEILILAGTGLGEAGMLDAILDLYESGGVEALIQGAGEMTTEAATSVRSLASGMFDALKEVKALPSLTDVADAGKLAGKAAIDILDPWLDKLASDYVLQNYPLAGSQLVILLANLIGTSGSKINTPEVACKTENLLQEYMKRTVNARLEKLKEPEGFEDAVTFFQEKIKAQNKKYNKDGYNPTDKLGCDAGDHPKCFTDKFKRGKNKQICTSWSSCYGNYAGIIRHQTEATFPVELFEKTCRNQIPQDQIDEKSNGYWMISLKRMLVGSHWLYNLRPVVQIFIDGKQKFNYRTASGYEKFSKDVIPINKNYEIGPVKKMQPNIEIKVFSDRADAIGYEKEYTIKGNIYNLWKNGYTPEDPNNFVDVAFSWRSEPKPDNKKKPKAR